MAQSPSFVITANLTASGSPVYLTEGNTWSRTLAEAAVVDSEASKDELLEHAKKQEAEVCDPYAFKVKREDGAIDPLSARERIRTQGPTVRVRRPNP